jgi:glycosyltransferase involved in cell wall biosynthesis
MTNSKYAQNSKNRLKSKGIKVYSLGFLGKRLSLIMAPFLLIYYYNKEKPSIIHAHTDLPDFVLSLALRLSNLKVHIIRTIHNTHLWSTKDTIGRFVEKKFNNDTIACVSVAALSSYKKLRSRNNFKISERNLVIYNGCELPIKLPHPFAIHSEKINIAYCGRLVNQKGTDILVEVIEVITAKYPNQFLFHIVGGGDEVGLVEKIVKEQENVIFYGEVPQMSSKLYPFDFLLMPSRFEGLPLIAIEASLSKLPVIASNVAGLIETLPSDWPLLFDIFQQHEALNIFEQIVQKSLPIKELQQKAFVFAQTRFSLQTMLNAYRGLYLNEG